MRVPQTRLLVLSLVAVMILAVSPTAALASSSAVASSGTSYATWYGGNFQGKVMANGQIYNMYNPSTTASNWWPFGTWVKVTNRANGKSVTVRVTDRGNFSWAFDLSYAAFATIASPSTGRISVSYQVVSGPGATTAPKPVATPKPAVKSTPKPAVKSTPKPAAKTPAPAQPVTADRAQLTSRGGARPLAEPLIVGFRTYFVQAGDSLSSIAKRFGVDLRALIDVNKIANPNLIFPRQQLAIPGTEKTDIALYGDDLPRIAERNGVSPKDVLAVNPPNTFDLVYPGKLIALP